MPLEPQDQRHLEAARGYTQLGMYEDATAELETIDPFCRALPEVLEVRLEIYRAMSRWDLMQVVAKSLAQYDPRDPAPVISLAYATRRAESLAAAKSILEQALERHPNEPIVHYNLACYECQSGKLDEAKRHLQRAFELQPQCRGMALEDPDLEPLWDTLKLQFP